jgi:ABC-2 type transport system permease protein
MEGLFATSAVVVVYQLCLRWFGRERLDGLMTMAQVIISVGAVVGGQVVPRLIGRFGGHLSISAKLWWVTLLPPAWFAGFDDALAGTGVWSSWVMGGIGVITTGLLVWLAFGKLAENYGAGLQVLNEVAAQRPQAGRRRWLDILAAAPPVRWWLRDSVTRASFLLTGAYLLRDRDVKLRVYPGLAPVLIMPVIFLMGDSHTSVGRVFGIAVAGSFLGIIPLMGLTLLQYSQQWQASDLFRSAPLPGPALLCQGASRAVSVFMTLPIILLLVLIILVMTRDFSQLLLLLPGIIILPIYSLIPGRMGMVPLSLPTEESKAAGRSAVMIGVTIFAIVLAGLTGWAWSAKWFGWFLLGESLAAAGIYAWMNHSFREIKWVAMD